MVNLGYQISLDDPGYQVPEIKYEILQTFPHDPEAFTEGLVLHGGYLYESDGATSMTSSSLRQVEISTGNLLKCQNIPGYFAEGITILEDQIFQLTYLDHKAFVYDLNFSLLNSFNFHDEGWGLTDDGKRLIMSNGSNQIQFLDPNTFMATRAPIGLSINGNPLNALNELEYVDGWLYANIWFTDFIYRIDPLQGTVLGRVDVSALRPASTKKCRECVLNGIASVNSAYHLYVTGKMWPTLFEIRLLS